MANSLSTTVVRSQYLTEATVGSFIAQCLKISRDSRISVSVSSTALNTARQIVTLVMDAAAATIQSDSSASSESSQSAQRLVRDISLFSRGLPGEMIKGIDFTYTQLDLISRAVSIRSILAVSHLMYLTAILIELNTH
jgi:hypothetical protein